MRILLVDDEPPLLELLSRFCRAEGHDVVCAQSAREALQALRDGPFDLLITDIVMPELDGVALVRRAKAMQPDMMSIVITGYSERYTLQDVLAAGATDLLLKPLRPPELRVRLKLLADQRRVIEQLRSRTDALQAVSCEMIEGLERELEDARRQAARLAAALTSSDDLV